MVHAEDMRTLRTFADLTGNGLAVPHAQHLQDVVERYALAVTPHLQKRIAMGDDAIARQFLPDVRELVLSPEELSDPIGDEKHSPVEGIVHRYQDRLLLKLVHICPAYCRFCFRREKVGKGEAGLGDEALETALDYIAKTESVWEVIFTGGDPLILSPRRIGVLMRRFRDIAHVKVLRWHTRVPVVAPERVTNELIEALRRSGKTVYIALHANHPQEFSPEAERAIARLADAGLPLISQSVLLKGINDDADTLETLMRRFVELRVKPYYLHHPDLAPGTSHFRLSLKQGRELLRALRQRASGLCQPHYMLDIPGGFSKIPVTGDYVAESENGYVLRDIWGERHAYSHCAD